MSMPQDDLELIEHHQHLSLRSDLSNSTSSAGTHDKDALLDVSAPQQYGLSPESERSYCIALHLLGLSGLIFSITCIHLIAPLILWLFKRSSSQLLDRTGKEVLNFQVSWTLYLFVSGVLCLIVIGWLLFPIVLLAWLIFMIKAAIRASNGAFYTYPLTIRFLK